MNTGFHLLAKPSGAVCNLDCKYCFFLSKEALYQDSDSRMSPDLLELYIRQLIEAQAGNLVSIAWQGGEPSLMGLAFFERAMELVRKHAPPGMQLEHTIQTNGALLDERWCAPPHRPGDADHGSLAAQGPLRRRDHDGRGSRAHRLSRHAANGRAVS